MHVISQSTLKKFWKIHPEAEVGLRYWYKLTVQHQWRHLEDVRNTFSSADKVGNFAVFDISGNNYRLITYIDVENQKVFIRAVLTHAEYDKNNCKKDKWYS